MRYFVRFSYRGTDYHGSQTQPNGITVQETLEGAFSTIMRAPTALTLAGRTDAGVHAREMWAHFDTPAEVDRAKLVMRLNSLLPADIAVYEIVPVTDDAHARFSATARTYEYHITTRKDPFLTDMAARVAPGLDLEAMNRAARLLYGRHDFASFCRVHTDVKTTFCTISQAEWTPLHETEEGAWTEAVFTITADRFLRNMVRAVVGTLFDVGRGKISIDEFQHIIDQKNRCKAGQSAPAEGLFLTRVDYPESLFPGV